MDLEEINTTEFHKLDRENTMQILECDEHGLNSDQVGSRLELFGENALIEGKKKTLLEIFIDQFKDILIWILLFAATLSALQGDTAEALLIAVILVVNSIFGVQQEWRADKSIEALRNMTALNTTVLRNGEQSSIDTKLLVPGDILLLEAGNKVPADGRIISADDLQIEESSLTGESLAVSKNPKYLASKEDNVPLGDRKNLLYMGTYVTRGKAKAVVTHTGMATEMGKIATLVQETEDEKTPFQVKLDAFGKQIGYGILVVALIIAVLGTAIPSEEYPDLWERALVMVEVGVSLAVAAIPEGLPVVITLVLALGVQKMAKKNAIVKRLPVVESLGSATVVCTDKTGTLTKNKMTVTRIVGFGDTTRVMKNTEKMDYNSMPACLKHTYTNAILCNDAEITQTQEVGDPTELALLKEAIRLDIPIKQISKEYPRIAEIPFNSEIKRMSVMVSNGQKTTAYVKGAPDVILSKISKIMVQGVIQELSDERRKEIRQQIDDLSNQALRLLAFAYQETHEGVDLETIEDQYILTGLMGIIDPPKDNIDLAVSTCHQAGVNVIMMTGDHKLTAQAIARQIGIIPEDDDGTSAMTGPELDELSDEQMRELVKTTRVFARISPSHKLKIVKALQANDEIVAMTGDGVNDAPALKGSDIGIAMGIAGTDVSKEAADMILSDDNFETIVAAIEEGRAIFDNMFRFIRYMLSSNLAEILVVLLGLLLGWPVPLLAVQILFINLVTDGLPGLAMSAEPHSYDIMQRPPRQKNLSLFDHHTISYILRVGLYVTLITLVMYFYGDFENDLEHARTMAFTTLVVAQLFNSFNLKHTTKSVLNRTFFSNKSLIYVIAFSLFFQVFILEADLVFQSLFVNYTGTPINDVFHTSPLPLIDWIIILSLGISVVLFDELSKFIYRRIET